MKFTSTLHQSAKHQVKFNVAIISNVHIYQFFLFLGGGGEEGGLLVKLTVPFIHFFFFGGGGLGVKE